jgi:hypothetical protein
VKSNTPLNEALFVCPACGHTLEVFSELLRPATGSLELFCPELLIALLFGPDCAGGFCAKAGVATINAAHTIKVECLIDCSPKAAERGQPFELG